MPTTTGSARPFFQKSASANPPRRAPAGQPAQGEGRVQDERDLAAEVGDRDQRRSPDHSRIFAEAQKEILAPLMPARGLTKSMVETEASDVRAELTEDIAAERMAND